MSHGLVQVLTQSPLSGRAKCDVFLLCGSSEVDRYNCDSSFVSLSLCSKLFNVFS